MNSKIKIEKDIPIPLSTGGRYGRSLYRDMEVGDSVFLPGAIQPKITGQFSANGARWGYKFATRKVDGGVRVWRTA